MALMTVHFYCRHLTHKSLACRRLNLSHPVCHLSALFGLVQMCKTSGRVCMTYHGDPQLWPPFSAYLDNRPHSVSVTARKTLPASCLTQKLLGKCLKKTVVSQEYLTLIMLVVMMSMMGIPVQHQSMLYTLKAGTAPLNIQFQHVTLITMMHPDRCLVGLLQLPISSRHMTHIMIDHPDRWTVSVFLQLLINRHALTLQLWPQAAPFRILATAGMCTVQSCMIWPDPGLAMTALWLLMMGHNWPIQQRTMLGPKGNLKQA